MKLETTTETRKEKKTTFSFEFKPTLEEYKKHVSLKVTAADPFDMMGKLNLPQSIGDIVILDIIRKEEQVKL